MWALSSGVDLCPQGPDEGVPGANSGSPAQGAAKVLILPVVQQFTEAFVQALQIPDGPTSDSGFKMEVLKVNTHCCGAAWS